MSYRFKRKESVPKAVRRLGRERIEHALECLREQESAEAVHCVRKDIKKVRAVLRLVRTRIVKRDFRRIIDTLKEAATHLTASRDAYIQTQTLQNLTKHFEGQLAPGAFRRVRQELRNGCEEELTRFRNEKTARAVERMLHRAAKMFEHLTVSGKGWKTLHPGVKIAYRRGQRAYRTVREDPSPENFHMWRKRVKDLGYQVRLLRPVWPEQMEAMANELKTLGQCLGDDHDLVVLRETIRERSIGEENARKLETLLGLIEERQRELRAVALALGARFYTERPSTFCNRLAGYWKTWRCEKKSPLRSIAATP